jgi:hypothetical protein
MMLGAWKFSAVSAQKDLKIKKEQANAAPFRLSAFKI